MPDLNVQVEELSPVVRRMKVDVPADRVSSVTEAVYRRLGSTVRLRGYRQGKVPRRILERHFADQVRHDVAREIMSSTFGEALGEARLSPVAEPTLEPGEVRQGEPFQYSARVEVRPEVKLGDWMGLEVTVTERKVTDEQVERRLEDMRQGLSTLEPVEGRDTVELGDAADVSWEIAFEGTDRKNEKRDDALIRVDAGRFIDGHGEALVGAKVGETREIVEAFPDEEDTDEELRGRNARITVTVKGIKRTVVPELDDELAKELGSETLEELRAKIRADLRKDADGFNEHERREKIIGALLEKNPVEVPPALVDNAAEQMAYDIVRNFLRQGLPIRDPQPLVEQMKQEARGRALRDVQTYFVLDALATAENIEVSADEVQQELEKMAQREGVSIERIRARYPTPDALGGLRTRLRNDRAYEALAAASKVTVQEASEKQEGADQES